MFVILLLSGCVTQRRCLDKFPPIISHDTIEIPGENIYIDTTIYVELPGDTVHKDTVIYIHPQKPAYAEVFAETSLAEARAWVKHNRLNLDLIQRDSVLRFKLDSAIRENTDTIKIVEVTTIEVPKIPKSFPFYRFGFFLILGIFFVMIVLLVIFK